MARRFGRRRGMTAPAATVAALLAVAGCSDGGTTDGGTSAPASGTASAPSPAPLSAADLDLFAAAGRGDAAGVRAALAAGGDVRAAVHRVVSPPAGRDRLSIAYFHNPALDATLTPVTLPPDLAARAPGGESTDPANPILASFGMNTLKVRLRSHPDVAQRWHADLLG